jgi:glucokinase
MTPSSSVPTSINHSVFAGIDVGGTSIKLALVNDQGELLATSHFPTEDERGVPDAVQRMRSGLEALCRRQSYRFNDIRAVGLGTPGTMDIPKGLILEPPNLPGWRHFPILDALREACDQKPVVFANDAGAAAYGEFWVGSGREHNSIVMFTLGTGVGGGIIIGGESIDGGHSHGSECGHVIIESGPQARICPCGQPGHLEAYASATAVVARAREKMQAGMPSSLDTRLQEGEPLTALMVAEEANKNDTLCLELIDETAHYLALGMVSVVNVIDPECVILGGAMNFGGPASDLGQRFLQGVTESFRKHTFPVLAANTQIRFASLGGDAGFIGAAGMARAAFYKAAE